MKRSSILSIMLTLVTLSSASIAMAAVPHYVNYQGRLTNSGDEPLDTSVAITFRMFNQESGGTELWSETHSSVTVTAGLFNVILGSVDPGSNPLDPNVLLGLNPYLEIQVGDEIITPRTMITARVYAFHSERAEYSETAGESSMAWDLDCSGCLQTGFFDDSVVTSRVLARESVTSTHIADGTISVLDIADNSATDGQILKFNGTTWEVADDDTGTASDDGDWTIDGDNIYRETGSVSIGDVGSPLSVLHVNSSADISAAIRAESDVVSGTQSTGIIGWGRGSPSTSAIGMWGKCSSSDGNANGTGVLGDAYGPFRNAYALYGIAASSDTAFGIKASGIFSTWNYGGHFSVSDGSGIAVYGENGDAQTKGHIGNDSVGVYGVCGSSSHYGVYGKNSVGNFGYLGGDLSGVYGENTSTGDYGSLGFLGAGVYGFTTHDYGSGVMGSTSQELATAVEGHNSTALTAGYLGGDGYGVYGQCDGAADFAVYGYNTETSSKGYLGGDSTGVYGVSGSSSDYGVYGKNSNGNFGYVGGGLSAVHGENLNGNHGALGSLDAGVYGHTSSVDGHGVLGVTWQEQAMAVAGGNSLALTSGHIGGDSLGVYGQCGRTGDFGVYGRNTASGNFGYLGGDTTGVFGLCNSSGDYAIYGAYSGTGNFGWLGGEHIGAYGEHESSGTYGYLGGVGYGVYGDVNASGYGVYGKNSVNSNYGYLAGSNFGTLGYHYTSNNYGYLGSDSVGVYGRGSTSADWAGFLEGKVFVDDRFYIDNDEFFLDCDANPDRPILNWDERDYQSYDRTSDVYKFHIDLSSIFEINSSGVCWNGTSGSCSDARFKKNVHPLRDALSLLSALRGVEFEWRQSEFPDRSFGSSKEIGFIAQELEEVLPELVSRDSEGYRYVDYGRITPLLVEGIKELKAENEELRSELSKIKTMLEQLIDNQ